MPHARVSVSAHSRHKCAATPTVVGVIAIDMDDIERKYRALVERMRPYPMNEAGRAAILAEVEAIYRAEREAGKAAPTESPPAA